MDIQSKLKNNLLNEDGIDMRWQTFAAPYTTLIHSHEFYELELTLSGHSTEYINGEPYEKKRGTISVLSPADFHTYEITDGEMNVANIMFREECMPGGIVSSIFDRKINRAITLPEDKTETLIHLFSAFDSVKDYGNPLKNDLIKRLLEAILIVIIKEYNNSGENVPLSRKSDIEKALQYIDFHFKDNPSLPEISEMMGYSPDYFSKYFKKCTNMFYSDYLNKCKTECAEVLLKTSNMSVTEVCFNSGFNSLSNFLRVFKERTGKTPKEYRAMPKQQ